MCVKVAALRHVIRRFFLFLLATYGRYISSSLIKTLFCHIIGHYYMTCSINLAGVYAESDLEKVWPARLMFDSEIFMFL